MTLFNCGSSYYAIFNVPLKKQAILRKKQIWVSLRTTDKRVANFRYIMVASKTLKELKSKPDARKMGYNKDENTLDYDRNQAETFAYEWLLSLIAEEKEKTAGKYLSPDPYMLKFAALRSKYVLADYADVEKPACVFLLRNSYPFPTVATTSIYFEAAMRASLQFYDYMAKMAAGEAVVIPERLISGVPYNITFSSATNAGTVPFKSMKPDLTLLQLAEAYNSLNSRQNATKDTRERIISKTSVWRALLGKEKTIRTMTSDDLQKAVNELPYITTAYARTHQGNYDVVKDISLGKRCPSKRITSKTLGEYISIIKKLLGWAVKAKYLPENPFDCVDVPVAENEDDGVKRVPFTIAQLNAIFHAPIYTGCRDDRLGMPLSEKRIPVTRGSGCLCWGCSQEPDATSCASFYRRTYIKLKAFGSSALTTKGTNTSKPKPASGKFPFTPN